MIIKNSVLKNALVDKYKLLTLHTIVNEAFNNALIINRDELTPEENRGLSIYCLDTLKALGGYSALENAIVTEKDPQKLNFLTKIDQVCSHTANRVASRIVTGRKDNEYALENDHSSSLEELVEDVSSITKDEYNEFTKNAGNLGIERISEIIKEKVINTIKAEKDAYDKNEQLDKELAVFLKKTDEEPEESDPETAESTDEKKSTESLIALKLGLNDPKNYVSFFSKLQEKVYESILYNNSSYERIPFDILTDVTIESTLNVFKNQEKTLKKCLESAIALKNMETSSPEAATEALDDAMVSTTILYTLLESYHTLNMIKPSSYDIAKFMEKSPSAIERFNMNKDLINEKVNSILESANRKIKLSSSDVVTLEGIQSDLIDIKETIDSSPNLEKTGLSEKIQESLTSIEKRLEELHHTDDKELTDFERGLMESDVSQMNKIASIAKGYNGIDTVVFKIPKDVTSGDTIDVQFKNKSMSAAHESFVRFRSDVDPKSITNHMQECMSKSNLASSSLNIIAVNTATGKAYKMK